MFLWVTSKNADYTAFFFSVLILHVIVLTQQYQHRSLSHYDTNAFFHDHFIILLQLQHFCAITILFTMCALQGDSNLHWNTCWTSTLYTWFILLQRAVPRKRRWHKGTTKGLPDVAEKKHEHSNLFCPPPPKITKQCYSTVTDQKTQINSRIRQESHPVIYG